MWGNSKVLQVLSSHPFTGTLLALNNKIQSQLIIDALSAPCCRQEVHVDWTSFNVRELSNETRGFSKQCQGRGPWHCLLVCCQCCTLFLLLHTRSVSLFKEKMSTTGANCWNWSDFDLVSRVENLLFRPSLSRASLGTWYMAILSSSFLLWRGAGMLEA